MGIQYSLVEEIQNKCRHKPITKEQFKIIENIEKRIYGECRHVRVFGQFLVGNITNKDDFTVEVDQTFKTFVETSTYTKDEIINRSKKGKIVSIGHVTDESKDAFEIVCKETLEPHSAIACYVNYEANFIKFGFCEISPLDTLIDLLYDVGVYKQGHQTLRTRTTTIELHDIPYDEYLSTVGKIEKQHENKFINGDILIIVSVGFYNNHTFDRTSLD